MEMYTAQLWIFPQNTFFVLGEYQQKTLTRLLETCLDECNIDGCFNSLKKKLLLAKNIFYNIFVILGVCKKWWSIFRIFQRIYKVIMKSVAFWALCLGRALHISMAPAGGLPGCGEAVCEGRHLDINAIKHISNSKGPCCLFRELWLRGFIFPAQIHKGKA